MSSFVYELLDSTEVVYVGIADDVTSRLRQHAEKPWFGNVTSVGVREYETRELAAEAESRIIRLLRPKYNRALNPNHAIAKIELPPIVRLPDEADDLKAARLRTAPAKPRPYPSRVVALNGDARYVSMTEAAEYLGVSTKTIRRYIAAGRLPAHRVGPRLIKIDLNELEQALDAFGRGCS